MTRLSVNINKIATLRNSRETNVPDLLKVALDIESFGAQGITVHPRPDERHIRYDDVRNLKKILKTQLNIEGYPNKKFIDLVLEVNPAQVTLVPDKENAITSNVGWDTISQKDFLKEIISELKTKGIRTSLFLDPKTNLVESAAQSGTHCIELYTENYATAYKKGNKNSLNHYIQTAKKALYYGLKIHAGHDLNLQNISFLINQIPEISEVSIGHALICESLYLGLEKTITFYLEKIKEAYFKN